MKIKLDAAKGVEPLFTASEAAVLPVGRHRIRTWLGQKDSDFHLADSKSAVLPIKLHPNRNGANPPESNWVRPRFQHGALPVS